METICLKQADDWEMDNHWHIVSMKSVLRCCVSHLDLISEPDLRMELLAVRVFKQTNEGAGTFKRNGLVETMNETL